MDSRAKLLGHPIHQMLIVFPLGLLAMAIIFDVRRYDPSLMDMAADLSARRAQVVLLTDEWMSPVNRYAKLVLPCRTEMGRTWDANGALFSLVEAIIARTTELSWATASKRMGAVEKG